MRTPGDGWGAVLVPLVDGVAAAGPGAGVRAVVVVVASAVVVGVGGNEVVVGDGEIGVGGVPVSGGLGGWNPGAVPIQMLLLSSPSRQKSSDAHDADVRKPGSPGLGRAFDHVSVVFGYGSGCVLCTASP
jgi:hypothetical protein